MPFGKAGKHAELFQHGVLLHVEHRKRRIIGQTSIRMIRIIRPTEAVRHTCDARIRDADKEVRLMKQPKAVFRGVIVLYFVIGLEILIMISPAAGFFYAAFNPFLLSLAQYPVTRWLTAFYLPHMISPPDVFLKIIRVAGSVLFVAGGAVFLLCAGQVYYHKFARKGVALGGLYSRIRHPQYLGLSLAGIGLSILWPRFLVIALWAVMATLYFLLAKDEERRMLGQFGEEYRRYMDRTGMFLPGGAEAAVGTLLPFRNTPIRAAAVAPLPVRGNCGRRLCPSSLYHKSSSSLVRRVRLRAGDPAGSPGDSRPQNGVRP